MTLLYHFAKQRLKVYLYLYVEQRIYELEHIPFHSHVPFGNRLNHLLIEGRRDVY
jgi:hypothetical protein